MGLHRSTLRYRKRRGDGGVIRERLCALAEERPRFGYRRLHVLLRREGLTVNHKRVYRLYRREELSLRRKRRRKLVQLIRCPLEVPRVLNEQWSMDFVSDQLADGRRFRTLNIVDDFSREALAVEPGTSLPGSVVVRVLDEISRTRGYPKRIVIDNGPEFVGRALDTWAYTHNVKLSFIQPGKPMQNGFIESFNGKFRDECLNMHWFLRMSDARQRIAAWKWDYNHQRPHSSLANQTPMEFVQHFLRFEKGTHNQAMTNCATG